MKCAVCGQGPSNGVSLFRTNEKGKPGVWACEFHVPTDKQPADDVREIVSTVERAQRSLQ